MNPNHNLVTLSKYRSTMKRSLFVATLLFPVIVTAQEIPEGELWLFSGQSNMELPISRCMDVVAEDVKDYYCDDIHYMKLPLTYNFNWPQKQLPEGSEWESLDSPQTAQHWGALCYYVGRYLQQKNGRPVTIINSSVGGSPIEAWMPAESLPEYAQKELLECRNPQWMEKTLYHNEHLYTDWQDKHNAMPYDESTPWHSIDMFGDWGQKSGHNVYGCHYLRNTFKLSASQCKENALLRLGAMRDADSTFVNGHYVGNITYQYPPRKYEVPAEYLNKGKNIVEIHLYAAENCASFVEGKQYCLETAKGTVSLENGWEHRQGRIMPRREEQVFLQYKASGLYNAMLAPLTTDEISKRLKGVVWYQGESNVTNSEMYADLLIEMITAWRKAFNRPDLPFFIVELASYEHSELETAETSGWVRVQDAQRQVCETMENVFLIPNRDLGEWNDIHPQDKKTLGERTVNVIMKNLNNNN